MTTKTNKKLGRRDMLKLMSAGAGGIAVSAFLPKKWTKPVIDAGVSPVHAAASNLTGTITGHTYSVSPLLNQPGLKVPFTVNGPLAGCVVTVDGMPSLTATTGQDGLYTITGVPVGARAITCVPPQQYWFPIEPATPSGVAVTVNSVTPAVQDFNFENRG